MLFYMNIKFGGHPIEDINVVRLNIEIHSYLSIYIIISIFVSNYLSRTNPCFALRAQITTSPLF